MPSFINQVAKKKNLKIVDAKVPIGIAVTASDIRHGNRKSPSSCAIAYAAKHKVKDCVEAFVFRSCAYIEKKDSLVRYRLLGSTQKEIAIFDRSRKMEPQVFTLMPAFKSQTLDAVMARAKKRRASKADKKTVSANPIRRPYTKVKGLREVGY
jgi:hypothetical protein